MITRSIGSSAIASSAGRRRSASASSTNTWKRPPVPLRTSPVTSVACSGMKKTTCSGSPSSSSASTPAGSSLVVTGLRRFQRVVAGAQTDAPKRSTKSSVPRQCAACVRRTRTGFPAASKSSSGGRNGSIRTISSSVSIRTTGTSCGQSSPGSQSGCGECHTLSSLMAHLRFYPIPGIFGRTVQVCPGDGVPACMGRVSFGIVLVAGAVLSAFVVLHRASGQSDRDYAVCGSAAGTRECELRSQPIQVSMTGSDEYEVSVMTGPHSFFSFEGVSESDVQQFGTASTMDVVYRHGRTVAVITPAGDAVQVPMDLMKTLLLVVLIGGLTALAGIVIAISGIVRGARHAVAY